MKLRMAIILSGIFLLSACGGGGGDNSGDAPAVDFNIACTIPFNGEMIDMAPGSLTLHGQVDNVGDLSKLVVNGQIADVLDSGAFSIPFDAAWGINFVDITAADNSGRESQHHCAFLLSDTWAPDTETLSDTISITIRQAAFDDSNRTDALDSFADILYTILNSRELRDSLHDGLGALNPVKDSCDSFVFSLCILYSKVTYLDTDLGGPNTVGLSMVSGGLSSTATGRNFSFRVRVEGHISGIPYNTSGWVTFSSATTGMTINTALVGGQPHTSLRSGSVSTTMGTISTNFGGLDGAIINIVSGLFNGTVRGLVEGLVRDSLSNTFNGNIDGVLSGLDVYNLSTSFDVPRIDGAAPVALGFSTNVNSLSTSTSRMLISMGTRLNATPAHARITLGAPIPSGVRRLDFSTNQSMATALHMGIINQAMHALWRGGYFDATITSNSPNNPVPAGATLDISTLLPPAVTLRNDGNIEVSVGGIDFHLEYPALVGAPVDGRLGGRLSCTFRLEADDLILENCQLEEQYLSVNRNLGFEVLDDLGLLQEDVLHHVLSTVVNDALPRLPLPGFELPATLTAYGLPADRELGLVSPTLSSEDNHSVLSGNFGLR